MKVVFSKATGIARTGYNEYFFPGYCYDLPDGEAKILIRSGRAYEPSKGDIVIDALIRLSYPNRKRISARDISKAIKAFHGLDISENEIRIALRDLSGVFPIIEEGVFYRIDDSSDVKIRIDKVRS